MKILAILVLAGLLSVHPLAQTIQRPTTGQNTPCDSIRRGVNLPTADDFKVVHIFAVKPKPPVLATAKDRLYRTAIRESVAKGANFAGHYVVARWGCGTGCHDFVVADADTGKVYDQKFREVDYHYPSTAGEDPEWRCYSDLLTYQLDSRLLIIEGCLGGKQCGRSYFVMESTGLKQVRYDPDLLKDGTLAPF